MADKSKSAPEPETTDAPEPLSEDEKNAIRAEAALTNSVPQFPDEVSEPVEEEAEPK